MSDALQGTSLSAKSLVCANLVSILITIMASVTTLEPPVKTAPETGKSRRPAPKNAEPVAPEIKLDPRLPKIGDTNAGTNEEYLASIQDEHWKHLTCYLYRTAPIFDRQSAGGATSIDKFASKFDYQEVLKRHGSGRYKFILSYAPPNGGQWVRVRQWYETLMDMDKPPRVPLGEWIDKPDNEDWAWAKPFLIAQDAERSKTAAESIQKQQGEGGNGLNQLSQALEFVEKFRPKNEDNPSLAVALVKMMQDQQERTAAASDPAKQIETARNLKELMDGGRKEDSTLTTLLIQNLMEELRELRKVRSEPAPDPLASSMTTIKGVLGMLNEFGVLGGAAAVVSGKTDVGSTIASTVGDILGKVVEKGTEVLPDILSTVRYAKDRDLQLAQIAQARQMNPTRPWEFQGTPGNTRPAQPVAPAAQGPQPVAQPVPPTPPQPVQPEGPLTPQLFFAKYQALFTNYFQTLKDHFKNEDGYVLRDLLLDREGRNMWNQFREDASVEMLMSIVSAHPLLKASFTPEAKAREFFEDLLSDPDTMPPDEEDDDENGDDETTPVGAAS